MTLRVTTRDEKGYRVSGFPPQSGRAAEGVGRLAG